MLIWFSAMMLAIDAAKVIEMRLGAIASGKSSANEMSLMVTEKLTAMSEARTIMSSGGTPAAIIENYRKIVAANVSHTTR